MLRRFRGGSSTPFFGQKGIVEVLFRCQGHVFNIIVQMGKSLFIKT